jgi:hypothetical protein
MKQLINNYNQKLNKFKRYYLDYSYSTGNIKLIDDKTDKTYYFQVSNNNFYHCEVLYNGFTDEYYLLTLHRMNRYTCTNCDPYSYMKISFYSIAKFKKYRHHL